MRSISSVLTIATFLILGSFAQGQFLQLLRYDSGVSLSYFVQADINLDGKTDIVGIRAVQPGSTSSEITVVLGTGTGGFGAPVNTVISSLDKVSLSQFLLGDFNGDGRLDAAVFGIDHVTGVAAVLVMLGNGDGTFQAGVETTEANTPLPSTGACEASAGDYNGDGKLDIAYLGSSGLNRNVTVLLGKGDGTFSPAVTTSLGRNPNLFCLATGDFNNDAKLDLAIIGGNSFLLFGNGDGTFGPSGGSIAATGSYIVAADLNGDGNLDLVAKLFPSSQAPSPAIAVLLNDGHGNFPTQHSYGDSTAYQSSGPLVIQDLNGDGHPDIVMFGGPKNARFISIFLNNGDGSFTPGNLYAADGGNSGFGPVVADLNGDKKVDLAFGNVVGSISVMLGNGNGTFQGNLTTHTDVSGRIRAADFNGDLKPDLLLSGVGSGEILLGNGDGTFTIVKSTCSLGLAIGDFNHDGKLDVADDTFSGSLPAIGVCLGNGDGTFTTGGDFDVGVQHQLILVGDFNNDGKLDLAASDQNGISILLGNGDGTFQNGIATAVAASFPTFVVSDFNNDGKLDIAALTSSGIAVLLGKGDGTFAAPVVTPGPTSGTMTVSDLNKDGKHDLLVTSSSVVNVLLGNGDGTFQAPVQYAFSGNITTHAAVGDFNLDGKLDVAVGDSNGMVDIFFGDGTGKLSTPPTRFQAGGPIADLAIADFNNDKKPDLAVSLTPPAGNLNVGYIVTLLHQ